MLNKKKKSKNINFISGANDDLSSNPTENSNQVNKIDQEKVGLDFGALEAATEDVDPAAGEEKKLQKEFLTVPTGPWSAPPKVTVITPDIPPSYKPILSDEDQNHLQYVDISARQGNYVLSIGLPGSGKTTFQSFLTYFLKVGSKFAVSHDNKEKDSDRVNYTSQAITDKWINDWKTGNFPDSTPVGENSIREIRFSVTPLINKKQEFNLSFLELSGEQFASVVPTLQSAPFLGEVVTKFLSNKKLKLAIVLVLDPQQNNDPLFDNFFAYIQNTLNVGLNKTTSLLVVVPNPKLVLKMLREDDKYKDLNELTGSSLRYFVEQNCPITYRKWLDWPKSSRGLISFSVGDISADGKIIKRNFRDSEILLNWLHEKLVGRKITAPFFKRLINFVKED